MRRVAMMVACAVMITLSSAAIAANEADERAMKDVIARFTKSWDEPGMPGFGDLFTPDADFVVITGRWLRGRTDIVDYHRELLAGFYKDVRNGFEGQPTIRFITPDLAVMHVRSRATYTVDGKEQQRTALVTFIFSKQQGRWMIDAVNSALTSGAGYSFGNAAFETSRKAD